MHALLHPWSEAFMQRALLELVLLGVVGGIVGCWIVFYELAHEGRGLLIATHDVEQASGWDRALCLNLRAVAFGPADDVLTLEVLEETYGGSIVTLPGREAGILPPHHHEH
jgi:ABC-type Mn2+/Zn2+ transport system ATPase subunit